MITVLHALDAIEANLIKGLLESEGVQSSVLGEYLQGGVGELPPQGLIRVVVEEQDYEQAKAIIENWNTAKFIA